MYMKDFSYITACTACYSIRAKRVASKLSPCFFENFPTLLLWQPLCTANVKKEIPDEDDTVDVLVNIAKNGAPLRNLNLRGIKTVKQLLLSYEKDPKGLGDVSRSKQFVLIFSEY